MTNPEKLVWAAAFAQNAASGWYSATRLANEAVEVLRSVEKAQEHALAYNAERPREQHGSVLKGADYTMWLEFRYPD